jgi:cytochrome c peroxidase
MKWIAIILVLVSCVLLAVFRQRLQTPKSVDESLAGSAEINQINEPILPIPLESQLDPRKVALGVRLFNNPRLSHDDSISCASCHSLNSGGVDRKSRSVGINGQTGVINAPTVFNSGLNFKQFWDGRAETLEDQIQGPTHSPAEMGSTWKEIMEKLNQSSDYVTTFNDVYADGIQIQNIKDAIATFERSLTTPNSRFDRFLRGDGSALTEEEKEGYRLFKTYGCASCHQGINAGGNMFQKFGVMGDYFADRGNLTKADLGRYNVTGNEADRRVFKVPSLRNVALTPPYFHDGSATQLENAVAVMGKYQLGRRLSPTEIQRIVSFLKTLSGEYGGKPL